MSASEANSLPRSSASFGVVMTALRRAAVLVSLTLSVALWLAFRFGTESTWWIELLRYVPFLAYLAPALVVLVASFWLGWWWRLAALLAVAVQLGGVMDLCLGRAEPGSQPLRLMTYNIKSYRADDRPSGYTLIADEIARHNPDLLVMQDAQILNHPGSVMPPPLQALLQGKHQFAHGNYIVVSRYPLRDCRVHGMSVASDPADFVRCTVAGPAGDIDLVTAHFISPREGLNATRHERLSGLDDWRHNMAQRLQQSHLVARNLGPANRPLIVAGDLNATERSPVVQSLLRLGLRDAFSAAGTGWGFTHGHSLRPHVTFLRIDHILVSDLLGVRNTFVGGSAGSEHRPVIADLWLRPGS